MAIAAAPQPPRFEHHTEGSPVVGVGTGTPRVSWRIPDAEAAYRQTGYELEISRGTRTEVHGAESSDQILVAWPAPPLRSREGASVRVRVTDGVDWSPWSDPSYVEAGLLSRADWSAKFISPIRIGAEHMPAPILRGSFDVGPGGVSRATLYVTAHGVYVPTLNGQRVGDAVLAPGWTSYSHRLRYQTIDVTEMVHEGKNTLELLLGNGWYRGRLGFEGKRALYGQRLSALAQLEVETIDGLRNVLVTDETWTAQESEIQADDLYDGQMTDLRRRKPTSAATFPVEVLDEDFSRLVAPDGPPVRATQVVAAQQVWKSPSGRTLVDFGQNVVGWVRLRVRGLPAGTAITVRHAEVLEDGELGTRPLRSAKATDTYFLSDEPEELLEPSLTIHGFRYAEVSGAEPEAGDLEAVVIGSDLRRAGWFTCSHELLNRLHENIVWSTRGNFVDIPTDCPQRDERLGWTGDIQVFAPTATFLFHTGGFLTSWLADLAAEQLPDGSVPHVVPDVIRTPFSATPTAAWGDAAVVVPWTLYQRTGDERILGLQFPSMKAWVDRVGDLAGPDRLWSGGFQYGDWLDPSAPPEDPFRAKADRDVVATAHFARSADLLAQAARVLGYDDEAEKYAAVAAEVRAAFAHAFVTGSGRILSDSQTVYALALEWALLPTEAQRCQAGRRLADLVRIGGFRISTGFVGTPLVCDALASSGHVDVAYRLLLQEECPSWLYPVTMGATTVWERWDSMRPDGSVNPGEMTSFNHYALGAVADWLHRSVAGLAAAAPGYREITVRPLPTQALTSASARHLTPYGEASVEWSRGGGFLRLRVKVPVGAVAHVHVPGLNEAEVVAHGEHQWKVTDPVSGTALASEASVRDVLDDEVLWAAVVTAAVETGLTPLGSAQAAGRLAAFLDLPATQLAHAMAPEDFAAGALALRARIEEILRFDPGASGILHRIAPAPGAAGNATTEREDVSR